MIYQEFNIDIWRAPLGTVRVIQEEADGRELQFNLFSNGTPVDLTGKTVSFYMQKPDNTIIYNSAQVSGNTAMVVLTLQMMAVCGLTKMCELQVIDTDNHVLKVSLPALEIVPSDYDGAIESADEFTALTQAIAQVSQAVEQANTAAETANTAAGNANNSADNADTAAESANSAASSATSAATSATNAAESANTAASNADEAATNATNAAGTANTAANAADSAADAANTATNGANAAAEAANEAASTANDAANNADAAAEAANNAASSATTAASSATNAAGNASTAANAANSAAASASTAASNATAAAGNANTAATAANEAAASANEALADIKDYVVEQGTSGIWTYRKWNSGFAELWGRSTFEGDINQPIGSMYYGTVPSVSYPFAITNPKIQATYSSSYGYIMWVGGTYSSSSIPSTTETGAFCLVRPTTRSSELGYMHFYVAGRWK